MDQTNTQVLREDRAHGSLTFPCALYCNQGRGDSLTVKHHWHEELEIMHFEEGHFFLEVNMEKFSIEEKCLCFLNQGDLHSLGAQAPCLETAIVFHPRMLSFDFYDHVQAELLGPLCSGDLSLPLLLPHSHPAYQPVYREYLEIQSLMSKIPDAKEEKTFFNTSLLSSQLRVKTSLLRILAILSDFSLLSQSERSPNHRIESIKKVLSYIHENYTEKIYIRDLAELINVNEQYFCRFFKQAIGKSPAAYVNEVRIKKSVSLLRKTDRPVLEICLDCGFNNLGNFLRAFKKSTDMTPLQYRKNHQARNDRVIFEK